MNIISNDSISFEQIKANIEDYLKSLNNWEDIKDNLPASNMTIINELIAGFASYVSYKQKMFRDETYLTTAKLPSSIYNIAKTFGYYISRYTIPSVKIKYIGVPTKTMKAGDILGKYGNYDIIYFGKNIIIEKLDVIDVFIGIYSETEYTASFKDDSYSIDINPTYLTAIDDNRMQLFVNDIEQEISKDIEDYVVLQKAVDYSYDTSSTKLFISDRANTYGIVLEDGDMVKLKCLETDGNIENFVIDDISLNNEFLPVELNHYGSNGDDLDKIKRLSPLFYSTLRRMVTEKDHKYIAEANPMIKSASAERDLGTAYKISLDIQAPYINTTFQIIIAGTVYEVITDATYTKQMINNAFILKASGNLLTFTTNENELLTITSVDSRYDTVNVTQSANIIQTVVDANVIPACCTVNIFYIKHDTIDEPSFMTMYEQREMANYLNNYKMAGLRIIMIPATVQYLSFKIKIKLTDPFYIDAVRKNILKVLSKYELVLDTPFDYGTMMVEVSKISFFENSSFVQPILSVIPNQTVFNVAPSKYDYMKFNEVEVLLG